MPLSYCKVEGAKVEGAGVSESPNLLLNKDINVEDRVFVYNQYDKRDAFPFSIVLLPFVCSNMPSKIF